MKKFPPFAFTAISAASCAVTFAACGVKAAPTPMMQGFEPRYQPEVNMRVAQNQSTTNPAGAALNSPVITPTAAFAATPVYTAPPVNNSPSTAPVAPQSSGSMAAPQSGPARP